MIRSMFAGVAGLRTHQQKMSVIGNNVANCNTNAYKSGRMTFQESIYQTISPSSNGSATYGGANPSQIGYGSKAGSVDVEFGTGDYEPTGFGLDCMIDGAGFFAVGKKVEEGVDGDRVMGIENYISQAQADAGTFGEDADVQEGGLGQLQLTRLGKFSIDGDGYLVDSNKNVVYGFYSSGTADFGEGATDMEPGDALKGEIEDNYFDYTVLAPIRVQFSDGSHTGADADNELDIMNLNNIRIDDKGNLVGTVGDSSDSTYPEGTVVTIAKLAIINVPNPNALEKQQGPYYKAVQNTGTVQAFAPGIGSAGNIITNGLEMANVDIAKEFSDMITTQRGFQANSKIITVSDEMLQDLVNLKR